MTHRWHDAWDKLRGSLWFVPALIVGGAVVLAFGLVEVEGAYGHSRLAQAWPRLFGAGAEGARGLLQGIAGAMITVAGVTFSITIVALTLASTQYSPRILRHFMRDRANQTVLGVFVGIYAYCLVVLRTIRSGSGDGLFVPSLAVLVGLLLALAAVGFLIYFIHHVATAIQATTILDAAASETLRAIDRVFAPRLGGVAPPRATPGAGGEQWQAVRSRRSGFVVAVDDAALRGWARSRGAVLRVERAVGQFAIEGQPLLAVSAASVDEDSAGTLAAAFSIERQRNLIRDPGFGVQQIVDIVLKALSPGINDTSTAIQGVDHLGVVLSRLAVRCGGDPLREAAGGDLDDAGGPAADGGAAGSGVPARAVGGQVAPRPASDGDPGRLLPHGPTFASLLAEAVDPVRRNADGNVSVLARLLEVLGTVAERAASPPHTALLRRHADLVMEVAERSVAAGTDRDALRALRRQAFAGLA